jgi:hypothetical protein
MALKLVDSKRFQKVTLDQFDRLAAKAGLPQKTTLDTVLETVETFRGVWADFNDSALDDRTRRAIDTHLAKLPLWSKRKTKR